MKKKNGFTLIELLAVIVILAVIALIATPLVIGAINTAKKGSFKAATYGVITAAENYYASQFDSTTSFAGSTIDLATDNTLKYKGNKLDGIVKIASDGKITIKTWDGANCAVKSSTTDEVIFDATRITKTDCLSSLYVDLSGANAPQLATNMIPIIRDITNTKWIKADTDTAWYNYTNKLWANAVLVSETNRAGYVAASAGTEVLENDVLAYLVWIPRYKYKLFNATAVSVAVSTIDTVFEPKTATKSNGTTNGNYLTHPAFTFGGVELSGLWVGKFETTGTSTTPTIKPAMISLTNQTVSAEFATSQLFNTTTTYGLTTANDSHIAKNTEWGAVAYLAQSIYGKNAEVWINPANNFTTGCAGATVSSDPTTGCINTYSTTNGVQASTTGNIYGVYDMSGGAIEYTMSAMYNSGNTTIQVGSSGFLQATIDSAGMSKYIDKYVYGTTTNDQTAFNRRILGDATGETRSWYSDYPEMIINGNSWPTRGGHYSGVTDAGLFYFYLTNGQAVASQTFRTIILGN